jgi:hypothetical protein
VALSHPGDQVELDRPVRRPFGRTAGRSSWWWSSPRGQAADLLVVIAILLLAVLPPHVAGRAWETAAFGVALALPLLWRRRRPELVFCVLAGVALVQWVFGITTAADAALLVSVYTVADQCSRGSAIVATLVMEIGAILESLRLPAADDRGIKAFVALSGLSIAAALMGVRRRDRRALLDSLEERALRLELERDQQRELVAAAERESGSPAICMTSSPTISR